jgi:hypothetical protein
MFGSSILDVAIGLIFIYLLLSVFCSAAKEMLEAWLKKRAMNLERGITELFGGQQSVKWVEDFYSHPLICCLFRSSPVGSGTPNANDWKSNRLARARQSSLFGIPLLGGSSLPSYIPARNFAQAVIDLVLRSNMKPAPVVMAASPIPAASNAAVPPALADVPPEVRAFNSLRDAVEDLPDDNVKKALQALLGSANGSMERARENIEAWFNSAMDRVSGWYKRWTQVVILILGLAVTVAVNADTIAICASLSQDKTVRENMVGAAQRYADAETKTKTKSDTTKGDQPTSAPELKKQLGEFGALGLPIGWDLEDPRTIPTGPGSGSKVLGWLSKVAGWVLTALAISLGAPFWFDLLNKFMVVRSTVKPEEKSPKEKSKS